MVHCLSAQRVVGGIGLERRRSTRLFIACSLLLLYRTAVGADLTPVGHVEFRGEIKQPKDLSAVTRFRGLLIVASDETRELDVLAPDGPNRFEALRHVTLLEGDGKEIDLEAVTASSEHVFAVGSHALVRKSPDSAEADGRSFERLLDLGHPKSRDHLFRLRMGDDGQPIGEIESINLLDQIADNELLARFTEIPSKENGIDIEGLAVDADKMLYVGFRGPVLRYNFIPVMALDFDQPDDYALRFVQLGGLGIRDLTAVDDGFLMLAGPVNDAPGPYQLWHWDGQDCLASSADRPHLQQLGNLRPSDGDKPEGLVVLEDSDREWQVLVVHDGPDGGAPTYYTVPK